MLDDEWHRDPADRPVAEAEDTAKRAVDALFERLDEVVDDPLRGPDAARGAL